MSDTISYSTMPRLLVPAERRKCILVEDLFANMSTLDILGRSFCYVGLGTLSSQTETDKTSVQAYYTSLDGLYIFIFRT